MRRLDVTFLVCVLAFMFMLGTCSARICKGKHRDCKKGGHIEGVLSRNETKTGEVLRSYYCDASKKLNIPRENEFRCCWSDTHGSYRWQSTRDVRFIAGTNTLKCEAKAQCATPLAPVTNMTRSDVTRYMGGLLGGDTYYDGDTVKYKCNEGYELVTEKEQDEEDEQDDYYGNYDYDQPNTTLSSTLLCNSHGQWIDNETKTDTFIIGMCKEIVCDAERFENIRNGSIFNYTSTYMYGEYLELDCDYGYIPNDDISRVRCETSDSFSSYKLPDFRCNRIQCPIPPDIENGAAYGLDRSVNGSVIFGCNNGYTLSGKRTWTCQEDGTWDSTCVRCNAKDSYCQSPCVPDEAILLDPMPSYLEGAVIHFKCEMNITYGGSMERVCLRNRQWSGDDIDCTGKTSQRSTVIKLKESMQNIPLLGNTTVEREGNTTAESEEMLQKSINVGAQGGVDVFLMVDMSGSIDENEFNSCKEFISALLPKLKISDALTGTRLALYMFASEVKLIQNDHYDGEKRFSTEDWQDEIQRLKLAEVQNKTKKGTKFYEALFKIKREIQGKEKDWSANQMRIAQQVAIIISDGQENMGGGDPKELASELKRDYGVEIYSIWVQAKQKRNKLGNIFMKSLASEKEGEVHFFPLPMQKDGDFSSILKDMIANGPVCADCGCTYSTKTNYKNITIKHHTDAQRYAWPWMAQLKKENGNHLCGGSIIDTKWILTAAHCFGGDSTTLATIDVGRLKLDDTNTGIKSIIIRKENVIWHEKYNPSKDQKYLYDIALVYLGQNNDISFDDNVHAICLGASNDTGNYTYLESYYTYLESGTYGVATGWGKKSQDGAGYSNTLKQMQMKVQTNDTCFRMDTDHEVDGQGQKISMKYDQELMFCAGGNDGDKVIDTCEGDSGGPFIVPYKDDVPNKKDHFLQTGIVSSSIGACMRKDKYGIYTRLTPELLDWISDKMAKHAR